MAFDKVVLVGPMGAGKTTIGRLLSRELGYAFVDSDKEIEARCGANIPWIFDVEGEAGFRARERQTIEELSRQSGLVLATGGGAVLDSVNRENLKFRSKIVYLKTSVEQQFERTRRDRNRPLLQKENPKQVLIELFEIRDPIYQSLADIVILTDKKSPKTVVKQIVDHLRRACGDEIGVVGE
ncbi:MAG: shikimate kinase AroK [Hahellaceae bacterium]|nr:shikimate kinase AroK [Hahellaceae bacterium]MCP5168835.1 shikimate kinase AroK [Hahellaceae bacterium]